MEKQRLNIGGMDCTNCALTIKKVIEKEGAQEVSVNFTTGEAAFIPVAENTSKIIQSVKDLGYTVTVAEKEKIEHHHAHPHEKDGFFKIKNLVIFCSVFTLPLLMHMFAGHESFFNNKVFQLLLATPVFIVGCLHFGKSAWGSLKVLIPNMDVLIFIGSSSAYFYSLIGAFFLYPEHAHNYLFFETSATIVTLVLVGNWIEHLSVEKTTSAIGELSRLQTLKAKLYSRFSAGSYIEVDINEVKIGDTVMVNEGEVFPIDGVITEGECLVDEAMVSGESMPVLKKKGDQVLGGTLCKEGNARFIVNRIGKDTTLQQIITLVKSAQENQPNIQKLGDKVSSIFVPCVLIFSALTFLFSYYLGNKELETSIMNSIAVLVISCPCAMGLATPTAVMVGIGKAAKKGILIKGGQTIEKISEIKYMVFDKTGTLTTGNFKINRITPHSNREIKFIKNLLYSLELISSHPIAKSICRELKVDAILLNLEKGKEIKGIGVFAQFDEKEYKVVSGLNSGEIALYENSILIASIEISDELKHDVSSTIKWLKENQIEPLLLSGDKKEKCEILAKEIGIEKVYSEVSPQEKLNLIEELNKKGKVAMVGDGINDAPALAKAHIGISLGGASDVAKKSAQIILLNNSSLVQIKEVVAVGRLTLKTIKQNLFWALFYNVIAIPLAAFGYLLPIFAALTMAFSDVIVIGNSLRIKAKRLN